MRRRNAIGNVARIAKVASEIADSGPPRSSIGSRSASERARISGSATSCARSTSAWSFDASICSACSGTTRPRSGTGPVATRPRGWTLGPRGRGRSGGRAPEPLLAAGIARARSLLTGFVGRSGRIASNRPRACSPVPARWRASGGARSPMRASLEELFTDGEAGSMAPSRNWTGTRRVRSTRPGPPCEGEPPGWRVEVFRGSSGSPSISRHALAGFVLYRVVLGLRGSYVGLDFIVSAAIIALAWLFIARVVVRIRLGSKSSALLVGVRETSSSGSERLRRPRRRADRANSAASGATRERGGRRQPLAFAAVRTMSP